MEEHIEKKFLGLQESRKFSPTNLEFDKIADQKRDENLRSIGRGFLLEHLSANNKLVNNSTGDSIKHLYK